MPDLTRGLREKGWKLTVVTERGDSDSLVWELTAADVTVLDNVWKIRHLPEERSVRLAEAINRQRPDVYVISISPDAGWLALPLLDSRIATMTIAHNDVNAFYAPLRYYGDFIDRSVGVSRETHRRITEECGIPPQRVWQIPYGVHSVTEEEAAKRCSRENGGPLKIGYVGRLEQYQKRVPDLVPIAARLNSKGVAFELHLVGDGSIRRRLEAQFQKQGLRELVRFWGWLAPIQVRERLANLDVFVLPSDHEGLPVALLEAMSQVVAPLVTNIASGNTELVSEGENGHLLEVGDIDGFVGRLETLARKPGHLKQLRRAAWETSRQYGIGRMVESYEECIQQITTSKQNQERSRPPASFPVMPSCRSSYPNWLRKIKWALAGV